MAHRTREEIEREFIELTSALGEAGAVPSLGVGDGILLRLLLDIRDLLTPSHIKRNLCNDPKCYPCRQARREDNNN